MKKKLGNFPCNIRTKKTMEQLICVPEMLLNFFRIYRISSIGPKSSIEKTFQKKSIIPLKKTLAQFFSKYRLWHTSSFFCNLLWHLWCTLWDHFPNTQEVVENMCFRKILSFQRTKFLLSFFSSYRTWWTSGNNLQGYRRYCDNYCLGWKINSLGTKRSIEITLRKKEGNRPWEKKDFRPYFPQVPTMADIE